MTAAIAATGRPILFAICEWGVDFPSAWAPALGNSWRISNDIIPAFRTIARILNQAVPQTSFAGPGHVSSLQRLLLGSCSSKVKGDEGMCCFTNTDTVA